MGSDGYFRGFSGIRPRPAHAVPVLHNERQARLQRVSEEAGAEHHAHQRVFGELQIQSNPSPTKLNFVGLAKSKSTRGRRVGGGEGVLQVSRIRIERTDREATIIVEAYVSLRVVVA